MRKSGGQLKRWTEAASSLCQLFNLLIRKRIRKKKNVENSEGGLCIPLDLLLERAPSPCFAKSVPYFSVNRKPFTTRSVFAAHLDAFKVPLLLSFLFFFLVVAVGACHFVPCP